MKNKFSTLDLSAAIQDIQSLIGMRVQNVYDLDNKTYTIKLTKPESKATLLFESGARLHTTTFDWPKGAMPSSFSMKLRKHIKQKRLEAATQLGADRVVDLKFGGEERACHVIVELYDRGNVALTDHDYVILNVLRPRTDKDKDVRFAVRERYPMEHARQSLEPLSAERVREILAEAKVGDHLRKTLAPHTLYGPALLEHALLVGGLSAGAQIGKQVTVDEHCDVVHAALQLADSIFNSVRTAPSVGIIITKKVPPIDAKLQEAVGKEPFDDSLLESYEEFHPVLFEQHRALPADKGGHRQLARFVDAVDEFFAKSESNKADTRKRQQENAALKKLVNVRKDHDRRLTSLQESQELDAKRAELIHLNHELVDGAILVIRSAVANQLSWQAIGELVADATARGDPVASRIRALKLDSNAFSMLLSDAAACEDAEQSPTELLVDIDLAHGAFQNARRQHDKRRFEAQKERKTLDASAKALKSAETKTKETLKQARVRGAVSKRRKTYWFEKFLWFVSSENYLIVGGRDAQQNELLVKRYMRAGDLYVHADLRGASSIIVKNTRPDAPVPPKTLNEAGTMAVCYSAAWEAKVVAGAWWVHHDQVTRTAPSGEYLTAGSFMIRGKKNYLPPVQLIMGFGFLFRLDDDCIERHRGERTRTVIEEEAAVADDVAPAPVEAVESADVEFPDVKVGLERFTSQDDSAEEMTILQLGPSRPTRLPKTAKSDQAADTDAAARALDEVPLESQPAKRGQKHRRRKLKGKYKDQDDEERELRMQVLGVSKPKVNGVKPQPTDDAKPPSDATAAEPACPVPDESEATNEVEECEDEKSVASDGERAAEPPTTEAGAEEEEDVVGELQNALDSELSALTATPHEDDVLLFAVPVCAPYAALSSFKHRVKLTPGADKRGKAARTAVQIFVRDRASSERERDLIKAAQDYDLARNLPDKLKISAPHLQALKQQLDKNARQKFK